MTNLEVIAWLSVNEAHAFMASERAVRAPNSTFATEHGFASAANDALRTLAETRRALADCEFAESRAQDGDAACPLCPAFRGEDHRAGCIFATIPRPK